MTKTNKALENIICIFLIILPVFCVFQSRAMEFILPILMLCWAFSQPNVKEYFTNIYLFNSLPFKLWSLFFVLCFLTVSYSPNIKIAIEHYFIFLIVFLTLPILIDFVKTHQQRIIKHLVLSLIVACLVTALFLIFFDHVSLIKNHFKAKHEFNRTAVILALWAIPLSFQASRNLMLTLFISALLMGLVSESASAVLVLVAAFTAYLLYKIHAKFFTWGLGIAVLILVIFMPNLAQLPTDIIKSLVSENAGGSGAHHRLDIWASFGKLSLQKLFFGYGYEASYYAMKTKEILAQFQNPNDVLAAHPHNIPLQIYYEGGILLIIPTVLLLIHYFNVVIMHPQQAIYFTCFCGVFSLLLVNFSLWQQWLWVAITLQIEFVPKQN